MRGRVRSLISPVAVTATGERVPLFRGAEQVALEQWVLGFVES